MAGGKTRANTVAQGVLPPELLDRLRRLRTRYAQALRGAAAGDFSRAADLRSASFQVGRLLAQEALRDPAARGGVPMLEILLAADQLFPELRAWNQHEVLQRGNDRTAMSRQLHLPLGHPQKAG